MLKNKSKNRFLNVWWAVFAQMREIFWKFQVLIFFGEKISCFVIHYYPRENKSKDAFLTGREKPAKMHRYRTATMSHVKSSFLA